MADSTDYSKDFRQAPAGASSLDAKTISPPGTLSLNQGTTNVPTNNVSTPTGKASTPHKECYWFAQSGDLKTDYNDHSAGQYDDLPPDADGRSLSPGYGLREERARLSRERQHEERSRRIDEMKQSAIHAQQVREQLEGDRRKRIQEIRSRDDERRQQVEERKKLIFDAEMGRKEAILRRSMEKDIRPTEPTATANANAKKTINNNNNNNRHSMIAFGSSIPRYWDQDIFGNRRAQQSKPNFSVFAGGSSGSGSGRVTPSTHSSEGRVESENGGLFSNSAARPKDSFFSPLPPYGADLTMSSSWYGQSTTSADSFPLPLTSPTQARERHIGVLTGSGVMVGGDDIMSRSLGSAAMVAHARRKTDLTPTIPAYRDSRSPGMQTPRASASPSRPQSSMSQQSISSHCSQSSTVSMRTKSSGQGRRPRPMSLAGSLTDERTRATGRESRSMERKGLARKPPRAKSAGADSKAEKARLSIARKPQIPPKPPGLSNVGKSSAKSRQAVKDKPSIPPAPEVVKEKPKPKEIKKKKVSTPTDSQPRPLVVVEETNGTLSPEIKEREPIKENVPIIIAPPVVVEDVIVKVEPQGNINGTAEHADKPINDEKHDSGKSESESDDDSQQSKPKITTEEEAKAALAEKRRQAREQAEREAELERQRIEEQKRLEEEQLRKEEEERQRWEVEQSELYRIEQERLETAIEEQAKRDEEERLKREEEAIQRAEREEQERLAQVEAEKQRKEAEEKLRKEEEERAERRKRVEAIMSRTRGKGKKGENGGAESQVSTPSDENTDFLDGSMMTSSTLAKENSWGRSESPLLKDEAFPPPENALDEFEPLAYSSLKKHQDFVPSAPHAEFANQNNLIDDWATSLSSGDAAPPNNNKGGEEDLFSFFSDDKNEGHDRLVDTSLTESQHSEPRSDTESGQASITHANGYATNGYDSNQNGQIDDIFNKGLYSLDSRVASSQPSELIPQKVGSASHAIDAGSASDFDKLIDFDSVTGMMVNEDNVNSNITSNISDQPYIAFEDNKTKRESSVTGTF